MRRSFLAPIVFVLICAYIGLLPAFHYDRNARTQYGDSIRIDWDTHDITNEVESAPTFRDTIKWWSGPWYEKVPYYRPITMLLFWAQYQVFGPDGRVAFTWAHRLGHVAFLLALLGFFGALVGKWPATLGVGLYAAGFNEILSLPSGRDAFNCWKDQCDVWSALLTVGACAAVWKWSQQSPNAMPFWRSKWWILAAISMVISLFVKELGLLTPIFIALTLFVTHRLRSHGVGLVPFFAIVPLFWGMRWLILEGRGHSTGSGGARWTRFSSEVLGLPASVLAGDGLPLAALGLVCLLALLIWWRWKPQNGLPLRPLAVFGFLLLGGAIAAHIYLPSPPEVQILRFFMGGAPFDTFLMAILLAGFFLLVRQATRGDRALLFAWLWIAVGFFPLLVQPPTSSHVHYPIAPGWSLWLACLLVLCVTHAKNRFLPTRVHTT